jgi:hypothetical protein
LVIAEHRHRGWRPAADGVVSLVLDQSAGAAVVCLEGVWRPRPFGIPRLLWSMPNVICEESPSTFVGEGSRTTRSTTAGWARAGSRHRNQRRWVWTGSIWWCATSAGRSASSWRSRPGPQRFADRGQDAPRRGHVQASMVDGAVREAAGRRGVPAHAHRARVPAADAAAGHRRRVAVSAAELDAHVDLLRRDAAGCVLEDHARLRAHSAILRQPPEGAWLRPMEIVVMRCTPRQSHPRRRHL